MGRGFVTRLLLLLITCYHHLKHSGVAEGVTVLRFQEDRVARGDTQAVYQGDLDPARRLLSLTLCARFFLFTLHSRSTFFSLSSDTAARDILDGGREEEEEEEEEEDGINK
ncbi:hypothetical protein O3P69_016969 [Scylla paramamosain]|uniref:Secreted protein n=1 Tax=Scylla paramamosain TaxID=85552 RepID=A0AAW0TUL8_SCYPA